jgi:hypothetical protein
MNDPFFFILLRKPCIYDLYYGACTTPNFFHLHFVIISVGANMAFSFFNFYGNLGWPLFSPAPSVLSIAHGFEDD